MNTIKGFARVCAAVGVALALPHLATADFGWRPEERWFGFNDLGMFRAPGDTSDPRSTGEFQRDHFRWIHEWGFNFVRLPLDYRHLMTTKTDDNWATFKEDGFKKLDQGIRYARKNKLHVQICLHCAPGYSILSPTLVPGDGTLRTDPDAQAAFCRLWREIARRYRDIPNEEMSFNLLNEPDSNFTESQYNAVFDGAIAAIRAEDPVRFIVLDGRNVAANPSTHFGSVPGTGQAFRGYTPHVLTHWKYTADYQSDPEPTWPLSVTGSAYKYEQPETTVGYYYGKLPDGYPMMVGEFGCCSNTPHQVALAWMRSVLTLFNEKQLSWALWNVDGAFGVIDSNRADVEYEDFEGHRLDRAMLTLLQEMKAAALAVRLPSEYLELEYLTSTGEQYVDTLIHPSVKTRAELKMRYTAVPSAGSNVGTIDQFDGNPHERFHTVVMANEDFADVYLWNKRMADVSGAVRGKATEWNLYTIDAKNSRANTGKGFVTIPTTGSTGTLHPEKNATFWLFGRNSATIAQHYTSVRIASATFWEDDALIRQLVPCMRRSDGAYGFYDISGNSEDAPFYPAGNKPETTSKLVPGPAVGGQVDEPLPEEYEPITCLRSQLVKVGSQWVGPYIDTKYKPNSTKTQLKAKMRVYKAIPWMESGTTRTTGDSGFVLGCAGLSASDVSNGRFQLQANNAVSGTSFNMGYGSKGTYGSFATVSAFGEHTFDFRPNGGWTIDGVARTASGTYGNEFSPISSLYIFARHPGNADTPQDGHYACAALYAMTLSEIEAGELEVVKRKFVPCRRKSDGVLGLYDVSGGAKQEGLSPFFTNAGDTTVTAFWSEDAVTLPKEYRQLKYIASTDGGNQYIDTGIKVDVNTCADLRFALNDFSGAKAAPFGMSSFYAAAEKANNRFVGVQASSYQNATAGNPSVFGKEHDFSLNQQVYSHDGTQGAVFSFSPLNTFTPANAYVFAINDSNAAQFAAPMRLYSLVIWNNTTLVRNFVPCLRKSDGKVGLYDAVNGGFYVNAASGEDFVPGPPLTPKPGLVIVFRGVR